MRRRLATWALRAASVGRGLAMRVLPLRLRAVQVMIRAPQGRVLLVRHSYGSRDWMLPGGLVRRGEPFVEGARREMAEELGVGSGPDAWDLAAVYEHRYGLSRQRIGLVVLAEAGSLVPNHEIADVQFVDPRHAPEGTSPATRRRLEELVAGGLEDGRW